MDCSVEELRSQMELNYWAAAYLAQATLKEWMGPVRPSAAGDKHHDGGNRHFIMTSSTVAFVGVAGYTPYAVAKTALRSLADSLRAELNYYNGARRRNPALGPASDMKAHIVFSGTISSPGLEAENAIKHPITKMLEADDPIQTEDEVATAAVRGLERGHHLITTQLLGRAMQASAWGGSPRNSRVFDTILSWITSLAWLFIQPDMDRKVFSYGAEHGMAWSK